MRNIKFKAWSVRNQHMVELDPAGDRGSLMDLQEDDNWKVMQYTGLKDKSGKEIYEGDIVIVNPGMGWDDNRIVIWNDVGGGWKFSLDGTREGIDLDFTDIGEDIEVIGNIYENRNILH